MARILIGTSGWHYDSWRGPFFPKDLPLKYQLQYYASQFPATELNGVFYRTPTPEAVKSWRDQTGKDFVFAWKASKFITHWKRLSDKSINSLELLEDRLSFLGSKAGPILFQLPPQDTVSNFVIRAGTPQKYSSCSPTEISRFVFPTITTRPRRGNVLPILSTSGATARAGVTRGIIVPRCSPIGAGESGRGKSKAVTSTFTSKIGRAHV